MNFKDKKVAILGWGEDTVDVVPRLVKHGAKIVVYDLLPFEKLEGVGNKWRRMFKWRLGEEDFGDLSGFDFIVRNPAVYRYRKEIVRAEKKGVIITSKTKIFFDACPAKIIGVTGTKGKGTTATLIYEMLKKGGKDVYLAGNIGMGMFGSFDRLNKSSWVVLELSSFQLIDLTKPPHIGVILMTTVDHLDWHKDEGEYVAAKANLIRYQKPDDFAVVNEDYENSRKIGRYGGGKKIWVSRRDLGFIDPGEIRLRGEHNRENVVAAAAAARLVGVSEDVIHQVIREFRGLEHRLEEVATVGGVTYFDDSIATTPETTIAALKAFTEPTVLIAGGSEKGSDFTELGKVISKKGSIRAVILIGLMAGRIQESIEKAEGQVKIVRGLATMPEIVRKARKLAKTGDVVLLSPGAASFDMFKNYKDRGDQFKAEVRRLLGGVDLLPYNTFRVAAKARYFAQINNEKELREMLRRKIVPPDKIFVLGKGANVLFVGDFDGLVIKNQLLGKKVIRESGREVVVEAASGEDWHEFVMWTVGNSWSGVENMAGVPGTVGAALVGNIAAYGQNFEDVFVSVRALDLATGKERKFSKRDCRFTYRNSRFKKNQYFVTSVVMKLRKDSRFDINYHGRFSYESLTDILQSLGKKEPYTPKDIAEGVIAQRLIKLPDWRVTGTAGSVFKNSLVSAKKLKKLTSKISELQYYPADKLGYQIHDWGEKNIAAEWLKIPVGRLLDELGWRGKRIGNVGTFEKHALCVVNYGGATGKEIYTFCEAMRKDVSKNYGIELEYELNLVRGV
jgi:UDP-N-acetylmuramoylalanine--D-glutamate ligase